MEKIKQIIEEIRELKDEPTHRSALRVYALLENNKKLFLTNFEESDFQYLLTNFETIAYKNPVDFTNQRNIEDYRKLCENFLFHCNRII